LTLHNTSRDQICFVFLYVFLLHLSRNIRIRTVYQLYVALYCVYFIL
jgi:hypothetical protein